MSSGLTPRSAAILRKRMLAERPDTEWVYFLRVGHYIKIGWSEDPERRAANIWKSGTRYARPSDLSIHADRELLATMPGEKDDERRVHLALWDFAVGCEFFVDEPPVRDFIDRVVAGRPITHVIRTGGQVPFPEVAIQEWLDDMSRMADRARARRRSA